MQVTPDEPPEAVVAPEDAEPLVARLGGGCRDDRVDSGCGTAADENRDCLQLTLARAILARGAGAAQGGRWAGSGLDRPVDRRRPDRRAGQPVRFRPRSA